MLLGIVLAAVNAIAPVVLLILLGYVLKCLGYFTPDFLQKGNWLVFHVTLPATLFVNVYRLDGFSAVNWQVLLYCLGMILLLFVLGFFWAVSVTKIPNRRGVVWQSTYRGNSAILGLAIAAALGGPRAETMAAVISTTGSALYSVLAVISLSIFSAAEGKHSVRSALKKIVRNPLIIGGVLGFACLLIREAQRRFFGTVVFALNVQLKPVYTVIENLKSITTPFALLVLGGRFEYRAVRGLLKEIAATTVFRLIIAPLIAIGTAVYLSGTGRLSCGIYEFPGLVSQFATPAAVAGAVMAAEMGGDEQLATQLVVWTSVFSVITMFLIICTLMWLGFLAV
ncbi:MAG: AEC family transporter [Ruminococcaceae bacterium]|nr:AEC family transporter [Oscillospiraceae bacterium]